MSSAADFRIRFQAPQLPELDLVAPYFELSRAARWFSNSGPCHALLESRIAAMFDDDVHVIPVSNATSGLMVALRAAAGERAAARPYVVVPAYTFVATAAAISWAGFVPLLVDVEPLGWHLDPEKLAEALRRSAGQVAAVLACCTFGTRPPAEHVAAWRTAADNHGVPLVLDSAAGFGATHDDGVMTCEADAEVFSFHATKPFAVGEGGCIVTRDAATSRQLRSLANFGFDAQRRVRGPLGINAKLDELHSAVALAVLDGFPSVVAKRRELAAAMQSAVAGAGYSTQRGSSHSTYQFVPVLAPDASARARCLRMAAASGIEVRTYFDPPLQDMPALQDAPVAGGLSVTRDLAARTLSLPMANDLTLEDVGLISDVARAAVDDGG